jgi:serine-type D-Ala-D-Ala carboxypeptidase/endopeptidase (penicillin-binding protein 4)
MANRLIIVFFILSGIVFAQKDTTLEKKMHQSLYSLNELRNQLDDSFNEQSFNSAVWGVMIKSLKTGEIIYKRNADKLFIPASNMKLFTSAAALVLLGPKYSYQTSILANGEIKNGILEGDLVIQGSGDPTISNRFYQGAPTRLFEEWADSLISRGIKTITGNIYGDDTEFETTALGKGWLSDYELNWFSAPSGALCFNDNSVEIIIEPGEKSFPAKVSLIPNTHYVTVVSRVVTTGDNSNQSISISRISGTNIIRVSGRIKYSSKPVVEHISIIDPTKYFLTVFKEILIQKGIAFQGRIGSLEDAAKSIVIDDLTPLIKHESVPMSLIIKELNKNSNNFYAEQLLKTIGLEEYGYGSTENGVRACRESFNAMGNNPDNMVMVDGSGLSRLDLVTPRQIVNLLTFMHKNDEYQKFYESLPIGGVDGTLVDRMIKTSAEGNVHAKAGYNDNVSSLSGYLKTVSGEQLVFSIMLNNFLAPVSLVNYIEDNVCNRLVNFARN